MDQNIPAETKEVPKSAFEGIASDLSEGQRAEFYRNLHEAGISKYDLELARLLKTLQLYKGYYESIPEAIKDAAKTIEKLKADIGELYAKIGTQTDAGVHLAGDLLRQAGKFREEITRIEAPIESAVKKSGEKLPELFASEFERKVLQPLIIRIEELSTSYVVFNEAIAQNNKVSASLRQSSSFARKLHLGGYALGGLATVGALVLAAWFYIHYAYAERFDRERSTLAAQMAANRSVLIELSKSQRVLELTQDPKNPKRKFLVMKDAYGWQSRNNQGVIEFTQ